MLHSQYGHKCTSEVGDSAREFSAGEERGEFLGRRVSNIEVKLRR
jgi:hypothetical protein